MLSLTYALWGVLFGILLSAPVGPVNIICVRKALVGQARAGFLISIGAAVADTLYAGMAAFGMNRAHEIIATHGIALKLVGGLIMLGFACRIYLTAPNLVRASENKNRKNRGAMTGAVATFFLTLSNPGIFVGFITLFTLADLGDFSALTNSALIGGICLITGVFVGAVLWWGFLARVAQAFKHKITDTSLAKFNSVSALLIAVFAGGALLSAFTAM